MPPTILANATNEETLAYIRKASRPDLLDLHEQVQDEHESKAKWLILLLLAGLLSLAAWRIRMGRIIRQHAMIQAVLGGKGTVYSPDDLEETIRREEDYLDRFTLQIEEQKKQGKLLSAPYLVNRARLYMGTGRATFYSESEQTPPDDREGWVVEYIVVGDDNTCRPCRRAGDVRYYLPLEGPMPGEVCEGRNRCRCRRVWRYLPSIYDRLISSSQAA